MSRSYDRMVTICGPSTALSTELTVASIADCAKLCDSVQGCGAFDSNGESCFLKRHFSAPNSSDLCALKGGWCGYRVVGPNASLSDTVVVTQTHIVSPAATRRFLDAQRSIRQAGGRHYVAFLIGDEAERDRCDDPRHPRARDLLRLRQVLGEDAVWCIDPPAFSAHWNDFFERTRQLPWMHELPPYEGRPQAAPHWRYRTRNSLGWNWSWTNCDLPGILGLLRLLGAASSTAASPRWLWTLDWDVGWTGNLADILASFAGAPHDFLAGGTPHPADKGSWVYFGLRSHLRDDEVWQTLVVPQRFSMRMVRAVDQAVSAGQHSYCEMRSPSLCQQQRSWCQQAGMAQLQPSTVGEFECCNSITEAQLAQRQRAWSAAPQGAIRSPGQLLHRIRDSGKVSASALFRPQRRARGGRGGSRGGKKRHQRKQKQKAKKTRHGAGTKKGQKQSRHKARASGGEETVDEVEPVRAKTRGGRRAV